MIGKLVVIILFFSLTSCATIFSKKTYDLEFASNENGKIKVYDSLYNLPAKVKVKRSKNNLPIVLITDSITKEFSLKPSISPKYLYGNLSFIHFAPVGYLVDLTTEKRFYYGKSVFLNNKDTLMEIKTPISNSFSEFKKHTREYFTKNYPTNKGQINFVISIPWVNSFYFKPNGENLKNNTGFLGLATGVEYYHGENKFLSLNASAVMDYMAPVPAPVSYDGINESLTALSFCLTENHKINRFIFGYGLNFSKNYWSLDNTDYDENIPNSQKPVFKTNHSIGLVGNGYFQFGKKFFIGINYKPSLYNLKPIQKILYEHVISLDLAWKFRLKK